MSSPEAVVFPGLKEVVDLVDTLCRRPRFGDDPPDANNPGRDRRVNRGQPIICLISPDQDTGLSRLAERLNDARPRPVPHCLIKLDSVIGDVTEVERVRAILAKAAGELGNSRNASGGRIRFRRFGLLNWLMKQPSDTNQSAEQRTIDLRNRLRKQDVTQRFDDAISSGGENISLPGGLNTLRALVKAIPPLLFRLRLSGRVPLIGRQYRWFLLQPHLTPEVPGGFLGFAERLTDAPDGWRAENAVQLSRLLTNAFLEDLRRAWRSPWRFGGSRRMTYPVMLLENITADNGGHQVLRVINHVRTEVGLFDPLLVISTSRRVPPSDQPIGDLTTYDDLPGERYSTWRRELPDRRRARDETAWYLYIPPSKRVDSKKTEHELDELGSYQVSRPPWWGRRIVPIGAVLILLAGLASGYVTWSGDHCGDGWQWPAAGSALTTVDDQCIGVTDGHYTFDPALADVAQRILAQNEQADEVYADDPTRTYVTMVDLQALTRRPAARTDWPRSVKDWRASRWRRPKR